MPSVVDRRQLLSGIAACVGAPARAGLWRELPDFLRRGFNLPDQIPRRADRNAPRAALRRMRGLGMTHIRAPVVAEAVLPGFAGAATRGAALDDMERNLESWLGLDFAVSVDMHPGKDFSALLRTDRSQAQACLRQGWRDVAARLARWPASRVLAEPLNEPATDDILWRPFVEDLCGELRALLPATTLIVGPAPYQRLEALTRWRPFADANVVYAVHFYDPLAFTHQGENWDDSSPYTGLGGVPFPLTAENAIVTRLVEAARARGDSAGLEELRLAAQQNWTPARIAAQFAALASWRSEHGVSIIVNEFGALRFRAPRADRLAWLTAVRIAAEAENFGWAHWSYDGGFGLLDEKGGFDEGVIRALLPRA